jgi:hypothetical protein
MTTRPLLARAAVIALTGATVLALAACGPSAGEEAAQAVYDACANPDAETEVLEANGNTVSIVVRGEDARAFGGFGDEVDAFSNAAESGGDLDDLSLDGLAVTASVLLGSQCLAKETGYPGNAEQLRDGESWNGWRFEEEQGTGSEFEMRFIATS